MMLSFPQFWDVCKEENVKEKDIAPMFRKIDLSKGGTIEPMEVTSYAVSQPQYGFMEAFNDWKFYLVLLGFICEIPLRLMETMTYFDAPICKTIRFVIKIYCAGPNFVFYYMTLHRRDHSGNHEMEVLENVLKYMQRRGLNSVQWNEFFEICCLLGMNRYDVRALWNKLDCDRNGDLSVEEIKRLTERESQTKQFWEYMTDWKMWAVIAVFITEIIRAIEMFGPEIKPHLSFIRHFLRFITAFSLFRLDIIAIQGILAKSPMNANGLVDALEQKIRDNNGEALKYSEFSRIAQAKGVKKSKLNATFEKFDFNMNDQISMQEISHVRALDEAYDKSMYCMFLFWVAVVKCFIQSLRIGSILPYFFTGLKFMSKPCKYLRFLLCVIWIFPKTYLKFKKCAWYGYTNSNESEVIDRLMTKFDNMTEASKASV